MSREDPKGVRGRFSGPGDAIPRLFSLGVSLVLLAVLIALMTLTESGDPLIFGYSKRLIILFFVLAGGALLYGLLGLAGTKRSNQNAMLIMVSCVLGYALSEGAIRIIEENPWQKFRVIRKMRSEGVPIYPVINPFGERLPRLAPLPKVLTLLGNEGYGWVTYQSDENGFRNPRGLYEAHDTLDVFAVGDSFTIGCDVPDESAWTHKVRESRKISIYNAGLPAASPIQELARLMHYGLPKKPRVVLWVFYDNDYRGLSNELKSPFLKSLMPDALKAHFSCEEAVYDDFMSDGELRDWIDRKLNNPVKRGFYSDDWRKKPLITLLRFHSRVVDKLIEMTDRQVLFHKETLELAKSQGPLLREVLQVAKTEVEDANGKLVFVFLPGIGYWLPEYAETFDEVRRRTLDIARSLDLDILDFKVRLDEEEDVFDMFSYGRKGGHFSIRGYGVLAEAVGRHLEQYGL